MTESMGDARELAQFRQQYYGFLAKLLAREPAAELLDALRKNIAERAHAARSVHARLGAGWEALQEALPGLNAESASDEFMQVFIGPFQPEMYPYESWYLTGQLFQAPLIGVRAFMARVGLERREDAYPDPEDALAFELEVMNWLVTRQLAADTPQDQQAWQDRQTEFLRQHLLIWGPQCALDMQAAKSAALFRGVGMLLEGLLALEKLRLQGAGVEAIETIEQAKRRYGAPRAFQGPMFDPAQPPKTKGTPS